MSDFQAYSATHAVYGADWNYLLDHGLEREPVFVVRKKGSTYEAIRDTGKIPYSGVNPITVLNSAFAALPGASNKDSVVLKGSFTLPSPLNAVARLVLDLRSAYVTLANGVNTNALNITNVADVDVIAGIFDGNKANNLLAGVGIYISGTSDRVRIFYPEVKNCCHSGIRIEECSGEVELWGPKSHGHNFGDGVNIVGAIRKLDIFGGDYYDNVATDAAGIFAEVLAGPHYPQNIKIVAPRCWNNYFGTWVHQSQYVQYIGGSYFQNLRHGMLVTNSQHTVIGDPMCLDNGQVVADAYSGIELVDDLYTTINGGASISPGNKQKYGVEEVATAPGLCDYSNILGINTLFNVTAGVKKVGGSSQVNHILGTVV